MKLNYIAGVDEAGLGLLLQMRRRAFSDNLVAFEFDAIDGDLVRLDAHRSLAHAYVASINGQTGFLITYRFIGDNVNWLSIIFW